MKTDNRSTYTYESFEHNDAGKRLAAWLEEPTDSRGHLSVLSTWNSPHCALSVIQNDRDFQPTLGCGLNGAIVEVLFWASVKTANGLKPYKYRWHKDGRTVPPRESRVSHGLFDLNATRVVEICTITIAKPA